MCSKEQFLQQVETFFVFVFLHSEKCIELWKDQCSNQKPASEIHSNLVPLIDPYVTIKIEDINHWVIALFAKHLTDVTNNSNSISFKPYQDIKQIVLELQPCKYQIIHWYLVFLCWSIKCYFCFSCVFICCYNWEMCKESVFFCSIYLSDVSLWQILINGFLVSFTHFWLLGELPGCFFHGMATSYHWPSYFMVFPTIFRAYLLLSHFAWNIFYIPKFPDVVTNFPKLIICWAKINSGVLILVPVCCSVIWISNTGPPKRG